MTCSGMIFSAPWYFGDAVTSKNCAPCECNTCGSVTCDNKSGTCGCKPNVEGVLCNRCVANHWGFDQCYGCQPCNCGEASLVPQCDLGTGQVCIMQVKVISTFILFQSCKCYHTCNSALRLTGSIRICKMMQKISNF